MAETSTCFDLRCGYAVPGRVDTCPRCGRKMRSSRTVRAYGAVMMVCGIILLGMMGTITVLLWPQLMNPGREMAGGTTFTGSAGDAEMILWLFGLVLLFGLVALLTGLWQVATGRRNRWVAIIAVALGAAIFVYGRWMTGVLG